jgi:hypothetical protein
MEGERQGVPTTVMETQRGTVKFKDVKNVAKDKVTIISSISDNAFQQPVSARS